MMATLFDDVAGAAEPVVNSIADMDGLRRLLSPDQIDLLMDVLVHGKTQQQIADDLHLPQSTVASRVVNVRDRLKGVGIDAPFPRPGRPRKVSGHRLAYVDRSAMSRLTTRRDEQGALFGEWIDRN